MHRLDVLLLFLDCGNALKQKGLPGSQQLKLLYQQVFCIHILRAVLDSFLILFRKGTEHYSGPPAVFQGILVSRRRTTMIADCIDIARRCTRFRFSILRGFRGALGGCAFGVRRGAFLGCTLLCIPIALFPAFHSVRRHAQLLCDFGASHPFLIKGERLISISRFHLHRHHYPSSFSIPVSGRAVVLFRRKSADPLQSQRRAPLTRPLRERF